MKKLSILTLSILTLASREGLAACSTGSISATIVSGISIDQREESSPNEEKMNPLKFNLINLLEENYSSLAHQTLSFGKINPGSGGTVVISTAGVRAKTGEVGLVTGETPTQGVFVVSGLANAGYSIDIPSAPVILTRGADSMSVGTFVSNPSQSGFLDATGSQTIHVGATLSVASAQRAGIYEGSYTVCVEYN